MSILDWERTYMKPFPSNIKNINENEPKNQYKEIKNKFQKNTLDFYLKKTDEEILKDFGISKEELSLIVKNWKSKNDIK